MKENHKVDELLGNIAKLKSAIDEKDEVIVGLRNSLTETQLHLKTAIEEKDEVITGLNESLKETEEYLEKSIKEWKKTVDEIYNSSTWKLASKFTGGQTKRKKN